MILTNAKIIKVSDQVLINHHYQNYLRCLEEISKMNCKTNTADNYFI